jgi:hypothetical protein
LSLGISEELFWTKNPKTLMPYIKAAELKEKRQSRRDDCLAYAIGAYVSIAIQSNVFMAGLADKASISKMPRYPSEPCSVKEEKKQAYEASLSDEDKKEQSELITKFLAAQKKYTQ